MAKLQEMTLAEVLTDPFILALAKADGWTRHAFTEEMHAASDALSPKDVTRPRELAAFSNTKVNASGQCCAW
jgi:hypothetical protein